MIYAISILLCVVIIGQNIIHYIERRDLYNRLMSKNLTEYRQDNKTPTTPIQSAHSRTLKKWRNRVGDEQ